MVYIPSITASLGLLVALASVTDAAATCVVATGGSVSANIASAFKNCANGGIVVFSKGAVYNLDNMIAVSGLKRTTVQFYGTLNMPAYNAKYRNQGAFFSIGGEDITFDGANIGVINGNGQAWYDAKDTSAPAVFKVIAKNSKFANFSIRQAPRAHISVNKSNSVTLDHITMRTVSVSGNGAHNTDAVDISNSHDIYFQNSDVTNGDDCMAINGNTSGVHVTNVHCTGSHGFSVGSLGKGGRTDTVSGIYVSKSSCTNCENGARIKAWAGGKGSVTDVVFSDLTLTNVDNPIVVTTHYCDIAQPSFCNGDGGSSLSIKGVQFKSISGSASGLGKPVVNIDCSKNTPCSDFTMTNLNIVKKGNTKPNVCNYLTGSNTIAYCK